jgi:hypothetical protein
MSTISRSRTDQPVLCPFSLCPFLPVLGCDNFLYSFKGAPSARRACGMDVEQQETGATHRGGDERQSGPPSAAGVRAGRTVGGAAAFVAPFGRKPYGAPSCRARWPR